MRLSTTFLVQILGVNLLSREGFSQTGHWMILQVWLSMVGAKCQEHSKLVAPTLVGEDRRKPKKEKEIISNNGIPFNYMSLITCKVSSFTSGQHTHVHTLALAASS